jgi:hypothetical protein
MRVPLGGQQKVSFAADWHAVMLAKAAWLGIPEIQLAGGR